MEHRFEFAPLASFQAEQIREWLAEESAERAVKWERGLFEAIDSIKKLPRRCPVAPESSFFGEEIRELLYGKRSGTYRVLYTIRGDLIRIVAILHASRGPDWP